MGKKKRGPEAAQTLEIFHSMENSLLAEIMI
jgi:hypothetical protein